MDAELCYEKIRPVIVSECLRCPGDFEDNLSEANYAFLHAVRTFDPSRGRSVGQRVRFMVRKRLKDRARQEARRNRILSRVRIPLESVPKGDRFEIGRFLDGLSHSGRVVVMVSLGIHDFDERVPPAKIRKETVRTLRLWGWSRKEIGLAFSEIRECLS